MPRPRVGASAPSRAEASAAAATAPKADPASSTIKLNKPAAPAASSAQAAPATPAGESPASTVKLDAPAEQPKKIGLKLKKNEESKQAQPSLPPGLEGATPPPAPEAPKMEAKQEAKPEAKQEVKQDNASLSLKKKDEAKPSEAPAQPMNQVGAEGPGLLAGISAILEVLGSICALVFFVMVILAMLF